MPETASKAVERALRRIDETEPKVRAFAHVMPEHAQRAAAALDANKDHGPLYGLSFGVKEVFDVSGVETTGGCKVFAGRIPASDATVVRRTKNAGAILVGTQVSHELTCGLDQPSTRNPWKPTHYPGGSSAGAGASVAVGSVDFALGTDAAGSVRIPAAMTGTVGFKPSIGRVSKWGIMREASATSIDNVGIVARDVSIVQSVLHVIERPDPGDPQTLIGSQTRSGSHPGTSTAEPYLKGLRVGILGNQTLDKLNHIYSIETDVALAFRATCDRMREAGAVIIEINPSGWDSAIPTTVTLFSSELAHAHRHLLTLNWHKYHPDIASMLEQSLQLPEDALQKAVSSRAELVSTLDQIMKVEKLHFIVTPTTPRPAMLLASFKPTQDLASLIPFTCIGNLTGMPAISLPHGFTTDGLPLGLQIVGRRQADESVLLVASELESKLALKVG